MGRALLLRWVTIALFGVGAILIAIGMIRYFAYAQNDDRDLAIVNCTVAEIKELSDGALEITFTYEYLGIAYSNTDRSKDFRDLNLQKGQVLECWVDMQQPKEALLPVLKPLVQASGMRYGLVGIVLVLGASLLWRQRTKA